MLVAAVPFAMGASSAQTTKAPTSVKISARSIAGLGTVLVNSKGRALYMFAPDKDRHVTCKGACAFVWPPVLIAKGGKVTVSGGVKKSLLGSDPTTGGAYVVTYKGWPLYAFAGDTKAGVATGQDKLLNGGYWWVITTTGSIIKHKPTGTSTTPTTTSPTSTSPTSTTPTSTTPSSCGSQGDDQDGDGDHSAGGVDDGDGGCI